MFLDLAITLAGPEPSHTVIITYYIGSVRLLPLNLTYYIAHQGHS